jgi:TolA-binding protein
MHFPSMKTPLAVLLLLALAAPAMPARAQNDSREMIELQHQVLDLKREVQNLRDQVARGGGSSSGGSFLGGGRSSSDQSSSGVNDLTAQLLTRVESLEDQVRRLRGRVDEVSNQTQRQGEDLTKQIGDLNFRLRALEPGGGAAGAPASPGETTAPGTAPTYLTAPSGLAAPLGTTPAPPVKRTPEMAMQEGNAALARRDYAAVEASARDVLTNNKTSPRVYDAQLLLAQALAGRKQFSQAAIAFDDTYKHSRKGVHAQDALLGLATSLTAINEKGAACDTLGQLRTEFPTPRADMREPITTARQHAGCH